MRALVVVAVAGCSYSEPMVSGDAQHVDARIDAKPGCSGAYSILGQSGRYRFTAGDVDYQHAGDDCASDGGHLAKIDDVVEDAFIDTAFQAAAIPPGSFVWIGLSDPTSTDHYVWYDGTPLGSYNGFPSGDIPNDMDGMHDCVDKRGDGPWAIYFCSTMEKALCECN